MCLQQLTAAPRENWLRQPKHATGDQPPHRALGLLLLLPLLLLLLQPPPIPANVESSSVKKPAEIPADAATRFSAAAFSAEP